VDDQFYVRIRGRVQGPFNEEKLRVLAKRGQLGRMHEVSTDGHDWKSASEFADLFVTSGVVSESQPNETAQGKSKSDSTGSINLEPPPSKSWYYSRGDSQLGPVDIAAMKELVRSAQLRAEDAVWCEGMINWATVDSIPELTCLLDTHAPAEVDHERQTKQSAAIASDVVRTLGDSRPWVLFIAITGFVYSVALLALGLFLVILGARKDAFASIAYGMMCFLYAGVTTAGSLILSSYGGRIAKLTRQRDARRLGEALRTLGAFWTFVAMVLIVILVNTVVASIWSFSIISSLSTNPL